MDQTQLTDQTLFRSIDAAELADQLTLSKRGAERGKLNQPESSTLLPDNVESEIINRVNSMHSDVVQDVQIRLKAINDRINAERSSVQVRSLETKISPLISALEQSAQIDILDLQQTREELIEQKRDFDKWRERRRLLRPAKKPKSSLSFFADLFLIAILEGGLNLFFFLENNEFGILGAFLEAFLVAGANILLCTVIGFTLIKRVNSYFIANKLIGFVSILAVITLLPVLHGLVAFYRIARKDVSSLEISDSTSALWTAVQWAFNLEFHRLDEMSIIMWGVGIILGAYAARKGYEFGDRYPDYTKNYWAFDERRCDYIDHLDEITSEMQDSYQHASQEISNFQTKLESSLTSVRNFLSRKAELADSLQAYETQLNYLGRALIAEYREANKLHRSTEAPKTFDEQFSLAAPVFGDNKLQNQTFHDLLSLHKSIEGELENTIESSTSIVGQLNNRTENAILYARSELKAGDVMRETIGTGIAP